MKSSLNRGGTIWGPAPPDPTDDVVRRAERKNNVGHDKDETHAGHC